MDDDFQVRNLSEIAAAQEQRTGILTTLLAATAVVSLLVGGIGVMNIMLLRLTERTREIGVRIAVGARSRHILGQFFAEALSLAGIALGLTIAGQLSSRFHMPSMIHWDVIAVGGGSGCTPRAGVAAGPDRCAAPRVTVGVVLPRIARSP